jgi:hypothetical protein
MQLWVRLTNRAKCTITIFVKGNDARMEREMSTFDFSGYPNYSKSAERTALLARASTIDLDDIHVLNGPPGGHGFRSGTWTVEYRGHRYSVYTSVPHSMEIPDQHRRIERAAALHIAALGSILEDA